jgi:hypothetical protein
MTINDPDLYTLFLAFGLVLAVFIIAWMVSTIFSDNR